MEHHGGASHNSLFSHDVEDLFFRLGINARKFRAVFFIEGLLLLLISESPDRFVTVGFVAAQTTDHHVLFNVASVVPQTVQREAIVKLLVAAEAFLVLFGESVFDPLAREAGSSIFLPVLFRIPEGCSTTG